MSINYSNGGRPKPPTGIVRHYGFDDEGTRGQFLMELHDLWSFGYGILTSPGWHSAKEAEHAAELEAALTLLTKHMMFCSTSLVPYAQVINTLPRDAKEIKDSQGESHYVEKSTASDHPNRSDTL